jgi:glycosyltransferase involved in cell wall biosynthesis
MRSRAWMRYHSVLFAIQSGVPRVGLAYDPKVCNLLAAAGCEDYAIDLGELDPNILLDRLEPAFADTGLPARLISASDEMSTATSENAARVATLFLDGATHSVAPATYRWWLDELSTEAAFKDEDGAFKSLITERRDGIRLGNSESWPYDIVCFPGIEWDFRWMRAQQLMSQFAARGHRVFFVSITTFLPQEGPRFITRALRPNVWELQLATPKAVEVYSGLMPDDVRNSIVDDLAALAGEFAIDRAVSVLHLATWGPAANELRSRLGWRVVYDCMDDWSSFAWIPEALVEKELELVASSDLVIVSSQRLWDKWSSRNRNTVLVRNAADLAHFQLETGADLQVEIPSSILVVGFFGALDTWFDVDLVHRTATELPHYFFALIGPIYDERVETLRRLPNVRLFGNQPYDLLPAYLRRFDACIIPFKLNAVTQSTDPVKFYEYIAQGKPVVSTRMPELEVYGEVSYLANSAEEFIRLVDVAVIERDPELREWRLTLAAENSWSARCDLFDTAIKRSFDAAPTPPRILFAYQVLSLGGVEIILQSRVAELRRRGCRICLLFIEEIDGRVLFEGEGVEVRICPTETELANAMSNFKPDWIVSIDTPVILEVARCTAPEARLVYEVHSSYPHMLAPLADRDFLTGMRGLIVPSASQQQRIRPLLAVDMPVEVVSNALSPGFVETGDGFEAPSRPIILWVGRLDALKRWRAFVEIASRLCDRTDAEFVMVSAGFSEEDSAGLPDLIRSVGLEDRFRHIRAIEHSRMPAVYQAAAKSGGCMVSTSANESFGMAVLEAMACGCPVVVPDVVGLRDLVRHTETGRLYPPGQLAEACEEVIETLNQPPELCRIVTQRAVEFASSFSSGRAADRFLAVLEEWSGPSRLPSETRVDLSQSRRFLADILAEQESATVVIFPPSRPWTASATADRAQRWAQALARTGCLVFYCDPQHLGSAFTQVENRIFAANVPLEVYAALNAPVVVASGANLDQLGYFRNPVVLYECGEAASECGSDLAELQAEWLALAAVVTVSSETLRDSITGQRPDATLVSDAELLQDEFVLTILSKLKSAGTREDDPLRLKALLAWRERQVYALSRQVHHRDRPAVEILQDAITEQKHILAERDKGVAFLRGEVAAREKIIAERSQTVEFLKDAVSHREAALTLLRNEIESRDMTIHAQQNALEFLKREVVARDAGAASHVEGIAFLRDELAQREKLIAEKQRAIESWQREVAARDAADATQVEGIAALREQAAQLEGLLSERGCTIECLKREFAARDTANSVQLEAIAVLREEAAQREALLSEQRSTVEVLRRELAAWDAANAVQLASVALLREQVARSELVIAEGERQLSESEAQLARRPELETGLSSSG